MMKTNKPKYQRQRKLTINPDIVFGALSLGRKEVQMATMWMRALVAPQQHQISLAWPRQRNGRCTSMEVDATSTQCHTPWGAVQHKVGWGQFWKDVQYSWWHLLLLGYQMAPLIVWQDGFYELIAGRLRNYMIYIIKHQPFTPSHFDTMDKKVHPRRSCCMLLWVSARRINFWSSGFYCICRWNLMF